MDALTTFAENAFRDSRTTAITLGVGTVVVTHTVMFLLPDMMEGNKTSHAAINLAAAGAIVYGTRMFG